MTKLSQTEKEYFLLLYNEKINRKKRITYFEVTGRRNLNILSYFGLPISKNRVDTNNYNGYGYARLPNAYEWCSSHRTTWKKMIAKIEKIEAKAQKAPIDPVDAWCQRLAKLALISIEEAKEIAQEKIEYKEQQIEELEDRQCDHYSTQREKLINKIQRSNPLRRITDKEHAHNIIGASQRHQGEYQNFLNRKNELKKLGYSQENAEMEAR